MTDDGTPNPEDRGAGAIPQIPQILRHLTFALSAHVRRLHQQGLDVPPQVAEMNTFLLHVVRARQEPPAFAEVAPTGQGVRMADRLLVTKSEAAERLGVSVRTIERLVATGRLPQVQVERLARFRVRDLERYVDGLSDSLVRDSASQDRTTVS